MVDCGVRRTPYGGVRAFLDWATDLYPYVNGKCLMSGIVLGELESSDMLDVIHCIFEDDAKVSSSEEHETQQSIRKILYKEIYGREYRYGSNSRNNNQYSNYDEYSDDSGFNNFTPPTSNEVKPYIPPTNFNPDSDNPFGLKEKPLG